MAKSVIEDSRLLRFSNICLAFPEATREYKGDHAGFLVRNKTFAYYLDNHHGDGTVAVCCKVLPGDNELLVGSHPARFYLPAYIGAKAWVGLRLDIGEVDWDEVSELALHSYLRTAPKRLASALGASSVRDL